LSDEPAGPGGDTRPEPICERKFTVAAELGLHARPAGRFAQLAGRYLSDVTLSRGGEWVSGRSVLSILSLAAAAGTVLSVRAVGEDAEAVVSALGELLESDMDAAPTD
jgi:phosphocarrier protein HPr